MSEVSLTFLSLIIEVKHEFLMQLKDEKVKNKYKTTTKELQNKGSDKVSWKIQHVYCGAK